MGIFKKYGGSSFDEEDDFEDFEYDDDEDFEDDEERKPGFLSGLFSGMKKKSSEDDESLEDDTSYTDSAAVPKKDEPDSYFSSKSDRDADRKADTGKASAAFPSFERRQERESNTRAGGARVIPMSKIVNNSGTARQNAELFMIKPKTEEDARVAVDQLLSGKIVIINLEGLNLEIAQYITDFVTGANYSIGGNFDTINTQVLVFAPAGTAMSGDFEGDKTDFSKDF